MIVKCRFYSKNQYKINHFARFCPPPCSKCSERYRTSDCNPCFQSLNLHYTYRKPRHLCTLYFLHFFAYQNKKTWLKQLFLPLFIRFSCVFSYFFSFLQQFNSFSHNITPITLCFTMFHVKHYLFYSPHWRPRPFLRCYRFTCYCHLILPLFLSLFALNSSLFYAFYSFLINVSRETLVFSVFCRFRSLFFFFCVQSVILHLRSSYFCIGIRIV